VAAAAARGEHRELVGGLWSEIGSLQLAFLKQRGLAPGMRLLDVGCGCFRGGVHFVRYLGPGDYYGVDINASLIEAGFEREIEPAGLSGRLPRGNVACAADFGHTAFPGVRFDFALAQSLFTHLSLNRVRLCLARVLPRLKAGGSFYATFFECPPGAPWDEELTHPPAGVRTHPDADPYHYRFEDLEYLGRGLARIVERIGDWGHPRGQKMARFEAP
jgi:SAM-dependent methyltransferase